MVKFILLLTVLSPGDMPRVGREDDYSRGTRTSTIARPYESELACRNAGLGHQDALRTANGARVVAVFSCSPDR